MVSQSQFSKKSIKHKIVQQVTTMVVVTVLISILVVLFLVKKQAENHAEELLHFKALVLQEKIEQRLDFLIENAESLTTNKLMVNALTDSEGRSKYLPPLIENFISGKDVISFNLVGFDGQPIYQSQNETLHYNESKMLRMALAYKKSTSFLSEDHQLVTVSPIEYYSTTQGAVIVVFDLKSIIVQQIDANDGIFVRLQKTDQSVFEHNYHADRQYYSYVLNDSHEDTLFNTLGIQLEVGIESEIYQSPIFDIVLQLLVVGVVLTFISWFFSIRTAHRISSPILELLNRVKAATDDQDVLCSPLGSNDELEDLARAFDERTLKLQHQAEHDSLTQLPNRLLFLDRLNQSIKLANRENDNLAVLFIDLDRFKEVNDSFGHDFGDILLKQVSEKMKGILRETDTIARLGGDEFTVLVGHLDNEDDATDITEKLMAIFKEPINLHGHQLFMTCSIGIAMYPHHARTAEELLKNADAAMYKSKAEGRNTFTFYSRDMTRKAYERLIMESYLRQAINEKQFRLNFQPQVDIKSGNIIGMECLIRWSHPVQGEISPAKFIQLAEDTGMIIPIDRWVFEAAISQMAEWLKAGLNPGVLSINLSMVQIGHADFIQFVKQTLEASQVKPESIMFEVTETAVMQDPKHSIVMLKRLNDLGIGIAIDDFGTGHSSLAYLKQLPIRKLKIDRSFIKDIPEDQEDVELTRAIIGIAHGLQMSLVAEGVETQEQVDFLTEHGCFEAQGYLFYKPMEVDNIWETLKTTQEVI